ncbi:MAG: HNH endonuclease [Lautropia sp.]
MKLDCHRFAVPLDELRRRMGADLVDAYVRPTTLPPPDLGKDLAGDGVDVDLHSLETLADGTLAYRGHRVLVYIRDVSTAAGAPSLPRYHLAECRKLKEMRSANRIERYVVANRDDGRFVVHLGVGTPRLVALAVCQFCLAHVGWNGFSGSMRSDERRRRVDAFELKSYFAKYPRDLLVQAPGSRADTDPLNDYPSDWPAISARMRARAGYRCSACAMVLDGPLKQYLDVHHRNGRRNDCRPENLQVLCVACHARQPMHRHLADDPRHRAFVALGIRTAAPRPFPRAD